MAVGDETAKSRVYINEMGVGFEWRWTGPVLEGFHITDHYNVNTELAAFQGLLAQGYAIG